MFWPESPQELFVDAGSLSPVERVVGFETGTFRFNYKVWTH